MDSKQAIRERVWDLLQRRGAARFPGASGRIPNFRGAEAAAAQLGELPQWTAAAVVKSNPDAPQLPVRRRARKDGKTLYMAVPRLSDVKPFVLVQGDPTIKRALADGKPLGLEDMGAVDLIVCGSVAVNRKGVRIGKGGPATHRKPGLSFIRVMPSSFEPAWTGEIDGEVQNDDPTKTIQFVELSGVVLDAAGNILGGGTGFGIATLPPAARMAMKISGGLEPIPYAKAASAMVSVVPTYLHAP